VFANPDFNPAQCNVVAAEHRENRSTAEKHAFDYLTFQVDLFHAQGRLPTNLDEVGERDNDIRYSSRTNICSNAFRDRHNVRHAINELHKLLPPELASTEQAKRLYEYGCVTEMDIVRLVYRPVELQGASKTYDFSRSSMEKRWQQGRSDAGTVLHASPWLAPAPKELGVRVFDVLREDFLSKKQTICRRMPRATWVLNCNPKGDDARRSKIRPTEAGHCETTNRRKRFSRLRNK
jgi:hypothetical protein